MTLEQIKLKIGERVDDPSGTAYADRYEGIFISAMIDIIKAVDKEGNPLFSASEYPELVAPYNGSISFIDGFAKVLYSAIDAIFVRGVYTDPITVNINNRIVFQKKTLAYLEFMRINPYLTPETGEGYWAEKGDAMFILIKQGISVVPTAISIDRVKNPSATVWGTSDLETVYHYGRSFIESSIKRSAEILKSEIGNE